MQHLYSERGYSFSPFFVLNDLFFFNILLSINPFALFLSKVAHFFNIFTSMSPVPVIK